MKEETLDVLIDKWNQALKTDIFEDKNPSSEYEDFSDNRVISENSKNTYSQCDQKYWEDMWKLSMCFKSDKNILDDYFENKLTKEDIDKSVSAFMKAVTTSPNPIKPSTVGKDQDIDDPKSVDQTYSVEDIEKLQKMKNDLEQIQTKLNQDKLNGKENKDLQTKIDKLNVQIDELSDKMTKNTFPSQT